MHQLLCGVNEAVFVDGYRIQILEVTADTVRIGLSTRGNQQVQHEIALPSAAVPAVPPRWQNSSNRPAIN